MFQVLVASVAWPGPQSQLLNMQDSATDLRLARQPSVAALRSLLDLHDRDHIQSASHPLPTVYTNCLVETHDSFTHYQTIKLPCMLLANLGQRRSRYTVLS